MDNHTLVSNKEGATPSAYLIEWYDNGERRRVQLGQKLEPWLLASEPMLTPLFPKGSPITDEEFIEEAQRRVNQGHWSPNRLMSQNQSDDRAKLDILRSAIITMKVRVIKETGNCPEWLMALASKCDQLDSVYGTLKPEHAFAVNTTFYGTEALSNHQPEGYDANG